MGYDADCICEDWVTSPESVFHIRSLLNDEAVLTADFNDEWKMNMRLVNITVPGDPDEDIVQLG